MGNPEPDAEAVGCGGVVSWDIDPDASGVALASELVSIADDSLGGMRRAQWDDGGTLQVTCPKARRALWTRVVLGLISCQSPN